MPRRQRAERWAAIFQMLGLGAASAVPILSACSGNAIGTAAEFCAVDEARACVGPGRCDGVQSCRADGHFGDCDCGSGAGGTGGAGGAGGSGGLAGGGSGGFSGGGSGGFGGGGGSGAGGSGGGGGFGAGGSGGFGGGGGFGAGGSGGFGGGGQCQVGIGGGGPGCDPCARDRCCGELTECAFNPACLDVADCLSNQPPGTCLDTIFDAPSFEACTRMLCPGADEGIKPFIDVQICVSSFCSAEC